MQAIVYRQYGAVEELQLAEMPTPRPRRGEVLVRVHAIALNPIDVVVRRGGLKRLSGGRFPRIAGSDFAGEVVAKSPGSGDWQLGDRVMGFVAPIKGGGFAEFVQISAHQIGPIPVGMSYLEAAALPLAGQTVIRALRWGLLAAQQPRVCIHGAAGGVGSLALQIAAAQGAQVFASCSARNEDFVRQLGATAVLDYAIPDCFAAAAPFDFFFDVYGNKPYAKIAPHLTATGRHVTTIPSLANFVGVLKSGMHSRVVVVRSRRKDLQQLAQWIEQGQLRAVVDQVFSWRDIQEATRYLETKRARGKVVLELDHLD